MTHVTTTPGGITAIHTPDVTLSKVWGIIIAIFLVLVVLSAFTIAYFNEQKNHSYDMIHVAYGNRLVCTVEAGHRVTISFTNDYCPYNSSDTLVVTDNHGNVNVLYGSIFIKGTTLIKPREVTFENNLNHDIVLQIGRCKSKESCNINF